MRSCQQAIEAGSRFCQRHFLFLLLGAYLAAVLWPGLGVWIHDVPIVESLFGQQGTRVTAPMLMLALLLLNAGLAVQGLQLGQFKRQSTVVLAGLSANLLVPVLFIFSVTPLLYHWLEPGKVQTILLGLALISSMPIAASSAAWSQNCNGNLIVSLALIIVSTLLSPLTTPVALWSYGVLVRGDLGEELRGLTMHTLGPFLILCVTGPSLLGLVLNRILGESRLASARPFLKLCNAGLLILLIYANGSVSLPQACTSSDPGFLGMILVLDFLLGVLTFTTGWWVGRVMQADFAQQTSLMFGLGMSNNGSGLVLASVALAGHPLVMLPIIVYNLIQHLLAGSVAMLRKEQRSLPQNVRRTAELVEPVGRLLYPMPGFGPSGPVLGPRCAATRAAAHSRFRSMK